MYKYKLSGPLWLAQRSITSEVQMGTTEFQALLRDFNSFFDLENEGHEGARACLLDLARKFGHAMAKRDLRIELVMVFRQKADRRLSLGSPYYYAVAVLLETLEEYLRKVPI